MALPNIELYEALKKDVSEKAARMIAEVVPQAGDLTTKADLAATRADLIAAMGDVRTEISDVRTEISDVRTEIAGLKSYVDSRILRYTATILVPISIAMLGAVGALIALVVKL